MNDGSGGHGTVDATSLAWSEGRDMVIRVDPG